VNLDEVVREVAERDGCGMVLDLFAEAINLGRMTKPSEMNKIACQDRPPELWPFFVHNIFK